MVNVGFTVHNLTLEVGTITIAQGESLVVNNAYFQQVAGTVVDGAGNLILKGGTRSVWSAGIQSGTGITRVEGGELEINPGGGRSVTLDRRSIELLGGGQLTWASGDITAKNNAIIDIAGRGGTFVAGSLTDLKASMKISGSGLVLNAGTFKKDGANTVTFNVPFKQTQAPSSTRTAVLSPSTPSPWRPAC